MIGAVVIPTRIIPLSDSRRDGFADAQIVPETLLRALTRVGSQQPATMPDIVSDHAALQR